MDARRTIAAALGWLAVVGLVSLALAIATRVPEGAPLPPAAMPARAAPPDAGLLAADDPAPASPALASAARPDAGPYPLDALVRAPELVQDGCPDVPLIDRAGAPVPWRPALRIHPAFEPSVEDVERAFVDAARARYGRDPIALLSATSYRCRTIRGRPERVSEHALGNALDVRGIVIGEGDGELEITVREHWGDGSIHDAFLHDAIRAVIDRARIRGVIGPPTADHLDHFHVDHGPSRFLAIDLD